MPVLGTYDECKWLQYKGKKGIENRALVLDNYKTTGLGQKEVFRISTTTSVWSIAKSKVKAYIIHDTLDFRKRQNTTICITHTILL